MSTTPSPTGRILVVDDERATLNLLKDLFHAEGLEVVTATSAEEARKALRDKNWHFDLVLTDIAMPGETGFDLLKWIKGPDSKDKDMPVLLVTAQLPEPRYRVLGLSLGAVDYVVRPVELNELVIRTMHAMEYHKQLRSLQRSLEDSENLALVGRLLAASNHEIKNLAGVIGVSATGLARGLPPELQQNSNITVYLNSLVQAASLLTDVAKNTNQMLQDTDPRLQPMVIQPLITSMVELMTPRVKPYLLRFAQKTGEESSNVTVSAQPMYVKQILMNLILNAHDAIQELHPDEGGTIQIRLTQSDGMAHISVQDNGIGLKESGTIHSFTAFASTKQLRGGQGLGLWLSSRLAGKMRGELMLHSDGPARGTVATLSLPLCDPDLIKAVDISSYFAF